MKRLSNRANHEAFARLVEASRISRAQAGFAMVLYRNHGMQSARAFITGMAKHNAT